jgi:signal transduction histidine kinase/ligand-binding sensor domain-containing protein
MLMLGALPMARGGARRPNSDRERSKFARNIVINTVRGVSSRSCVVIAMAITTIVLSPVAIALDPNLTIRQLHHTAWGPKQGAPLGGTFDLAQTSDGYLWMVGPAGLYRFDGISFERMELPLDPKVSSFSLYSIFAPRRGGLWIGFTFGGVAFLRDGHWQVYTAGDGVPPGSVYYFAETPDDTLWVITNGGLARFDGTRWKVVGSEMGLPPVYPPVMFVDGQGTLWAGGGGSLFFLRAGEKRFRNQPVTTREPWTSYGVGGEAMSESSEGTVWLNVGWGIVPVAQNPPPVGRRRSTHSVVFDDDGALWAAAASGLRRISRPQHQVLGTVIRLADLADAYSETDGLTGHPFAVLVDREGNFWTGTGNGLDRFSEPNLEAPLQSSDNRKALPSIDDIGLAPSDDAGGLWVTNSLDALLRYKDGKLSQPILTQHISCLLRAPDGTVWVGGSGTLWREQKERLESLSAPAPLHDTQALAVDKSGDLWASFVRSWVFRLKNGTWTSYGGIAALPRGPAITIVRDRRDRLWFSYVGGNVAVLDGEEVRIYGADDGLKIGNVMANYSGRTDQWLGGGLGLARFDGKRFHDVRSVPELLLDGITGIVETAGGDLWLNARIGIVHLAATELEHSRLDPSYPVRGEALGAFDGLVGTAARVRPLPSAIQAGDGKLWFSTDGGFYGIDPARQVHNQTPPPVLIRALSVGDRALDLKPGLRLPVRTTAVRFDYVGLSLTAAEKVRYRYRLEGLDSDWRPLTASRQALYTNLRPGKYTFHVIAANNDGIWNDRGASLAFSIPPAFIQTGWFLALCLASGALAVWALVRLRDRQIATRVRGRLEERMAERERIARELHDTLLQSFQALMLRIRTVHSLLSTRPEEARQTLESAIDAAREALTEGRQAVQGLRSAAAVDTHEFNDAIRTLGEELARDPTHVGSVELRLNTEGTPCALEPLVRDEIYRIAGEALRNAFRHAEASHIEVQLGYGESSFELRVRDDGKGIDPRFMSDHALPGHYGLCGMQERAKMIGGKLTIWSAPNSGTELELRVPGETAYATAQWTPGSWLARKLSATRAHVKL